MKILKFLGKAVLAVLFVIIGVADVLLIGGGTILFDMFGKESKKNE